MSELTQRLPAVAADPIRRESIKASLTLHFLRAAMASFRTVPAVSPKQEQHLTMDVHRTV
jgi:hypothetical protein